MNSGTDLACPSACTCACFVMQGWPICHFTMTDTVTGFWPLSREPESGLLALSRAPGSHCQHQIGQARPCCVILWGKPKFLKSFHFLNPIGMDLRGVNSSSEVDTQNSSWGKCQKEMDQGMSPKVIGKRAVVQWVCLEAPATATIQEHRMIYSFKGLTLETLGLALTFISEAETISLILLNWGISLPFWGIRSSAWTTGVLAYALSTNMLWLRIWSRCSF